MHGRCMVIAGTILVALLEACLSRALNVQILTPISDTRLESSSSCEPGLWADDRCFLDPGYGLVYRMAELAVDHFNRRDEMFVKRFSELQGCDVELNATFLDAGVSSDDAIGSLMDGYADEKPDGLIVGPIAQDAVPIVAKLSAATGVPILASWTTSELLSDKTNYKTFGRTIPSDYDDALAICSLFSVKKFDHIGILHVDTAYGKRFSSNIGHHCETLGLKTIKMVTIDHEDEEQLQHQMGLLQRTNIRVFVLVVDGNEDAEFLSSIVDTGIALDLFSSSMWVCTSKIANQWIETLNPSQKAALNGTLQVVSIGGTASNPVWGKFKNQFERVNPNLEGSRFPPKWKSHNAGLDYSSTYMRDMGAYLFDAIAAMGIAACNRGNQTFHQVLQQLSFDGLSGRICFDNTAPTERCSSTASFELSNILFNGEVMTQLPVAMFETGTWVFMRDLIYSGGALETPSDVFRFDEEKNWSTQVKSVCYFLGALNIALAFGFFMWTLKHRKCVPVRASQVPFLATIAVGVITSSSAIFLVAVDDESLQDTPDEILPYTGDFTKGNVACMGHIWIYSIGLTLTYSALFAKMWRINNIFQNRSMRRFVIANKTLIQIIVSLLMVDITLLASWTIVAPLKFQRTSVDKDTFGYTVESVGMCVNDHSSIFIALLVLFHLAILVYGNIIAYRCRGINTGLAEGKYLALAMWSNFQVFILGIPVLVIVSDIPAATMLVKGGIIFLNDFSCLMFLFMPKLIAVHFKLQDLSGKGGEFFSSSVSASETEVGDSSSTSPRSSFRTPKRHAQVAVPQA